MDAETLTATQRDRRFDWSTFVLQKSKRPDRFIARFDSWMYKDNDYWTFGPDTNSNKKFLIASFYTTTGVRAIVSTSDPRLLSLPHTVDHCLGRDVNEKRYLCVDNSAHYSTRLLDCLHDRNIVLVALPECSADLKLGQPYLEPAFWWSLQSQRFDTREEGLKEYRKCICLIVGNLGSNIFQGWFDRLRKCVRNKGNYVKLIDVKVGLCPFNQPSNAIMEPNASTRSRALVHAPTANRGTEEPTNTNIETTDSCVHWHFVEPRLEPKEQSHHEDEPPSMELATPSYSDYELKTNPLVFLSTVVASSPKMVVPQQSATAQQNSGNNVQTRVVFRQQRRLAPAPAKGSLSAAGEASNVGPRNSDEDGNDEAQSYTGQPLLLECATNEKRYPKPAYPYTYLCFLAIKNSLINAASVQDVYRFVSEHFPYFQTAPTGWKNSLRHTLSRSKNFKKIATKSPRDSHKRLHIWIIDPLKVEIMEAQLQRKTNTYFGNLRQAISHPENLAPLVRGEMTYEVDLSTDIGDSSDDFEMHNEMMMASQLDGSAASHDSSNVSQGDEIDVDDDDDDKEALNLPSEYEPDPAAKRQKPSSGS